MLTTAFTIYSTWGAFLYLRAFELGQIVKAKQGLAGW